MKRTFLGLFTAATLFAGVVCAADPSSSPQERTASYQHAVRTVLAERGWSIVSDKTGRLIAERPSVNSEDGTREFVVGAGLDKRVRLKIYFRPDGQGEVATTAFTSINYYNQLDPYSVGQSSFRPVAYRSPKLTKEYLDIMAEAKANKGHVAQVDSGSQRKLVAK